MMMMHHAPHHNTQIRTGTLVSPTIISPTTRTNPPNHPTGTESSSLHTNAVTQPQHVTNHEERYLGPIDLDTLSEEDLYFDENNDDNKDGTDRNTSRDTNGGSATNIALVTTNTSDIFASIDDDPTKSASTSSNGINHEPKSHLHIHDENPLKHSFDFTTENDDYSYRNNPEMLQHPHDEVISSGPIPDDMGTPLSSLQLIHNNSKSSSSAFQPILQTSDENFDCFPDCNTFLLSSLMMMASASSSEKAPPSEAPIIGTELTSAPTPALLKEPHSIEMNQGEEDDVEPNDSKSSNIGAIVEEAEAVVPPTNDMEHRHDDTPLQTNPSISSRSSTISQPNQLNNPNTTTNIDPLLLLLQKSSSAIDGGGSGSASPKRHPNELDAMLLRVLQQSKDEADEITTVASTDLHLKKNMDATAAPTTKFIPSLEESIIDDVGGLMGALAAGPVDVDDFIPEDSYWAMDTHEFILDELELSRQLIGYHEGCEPPTINDISLLTDDDDDDDEDEAVPVVMKKVIKRDVRQDLILQRTNKMTRQRTSATADSNELIRRSQAIQQQQQQQQQQQFANRGLPQRPAAISQKNRIRSDPSRTTMSSQKQPSYPTNRFPTPTIMSRQKQQRQQVSPLRNAAKSVSTKPQMQQRQQQRPTQPVTKIPHGSDRNPANKRFLQHPTTPTIPTKTNVSSLLPPSSPVYMNHIRHKNVITTAAPATGISTTRTNDPNTELVRDTLVPVQASRHHHRRRVVDIDLSTPSPPLRYGSSSSSPMAVSTRNDRHYVMSSTVHSPPPPLPTTTTSAHRSKYSTTAAEV
jgi:hypothetical protein